VINIYAIYTTIFGDERRQTHRRPQCNREPAPRKRPNTAAELTVV